MEEILILILVGFAFVSCQISECSSVRRYEACIAHHSPKECADGNSK